MPEPTYTELVNSLEDFITAGDVIVSGGRRFKVIKVNPANYKSVAEDGSNWNVRRRASVKKAADQSWDGPEVKSEWDLYQETQQAGIVLGTCVELATTALAHRYPGKYVVIAKPGSGKLRLAKLGGDGDRYLRNIEPREVKVVDA